MKNTLCYLQMKKKILDQLTWVDVREVVRTADAILTHETGRYPTEEAYYKEVLNRLKIKAE